MLVTSEKQNTRCRFESSVNNVGYIKANRTQDIGFESSVNNVGYIKANRTQDIGFESSVNK